MKAIADAVGALKAALAAEGITEFAIHLSSGEDGDRLKAAMGRDNSGEILARGFRYQAGIAGVPLSWPMKEGEEIPF